MKGEEPRLLWRQKEGEGWTAGDGDVDARREVRALKEREEVAVSGCVILCDFSREKGGEIRVQVKTVAREEN